MSLVGKYFTGFVASLVVTVGAYELATSGMTGTRVLLLLGALALLQLGVQLYFFLHLGDESKPRIKLLTFGFMSGILLIIVAGSLWIMHHLNYNMMDMTPDEKDYYMTTQKDKGF